MYVCIYVLFCEQCMCIYMYVLYTIAVEYVCMYVCMYVCICTYVCAILWAMHVCMYICNIDMRKIHFVCMYAVARAPPEITRQRLLHFVSSLENHLVDLGGEHSLDLVVDLGIVRLQKLKVLQSQLSIDELPNLREANWLHSKLLFSHFHKRHVFGKLRAFRYVQRAGDGRARLQNAVGAD